MSPKFSFYIIFFIPYYLFDAMFANNNISNKIKLSRILYFVFLNTIWIVLIFILPGNYVLKYCSANLGILGLLAGNIYSYVDSVEILFGKNEEDRLHVLLDILVSIGSIAMMMLFAFVPYMAYYQYVTISLSKVKIGFLSLINIITIIQLIFIRTHSQG